jgi:STAS domain
VRVLLDENVPRALIPRLADHDLSTVQGGIKNGDLLERTRGIADVFVTMDRKLEKQHDLSLLPFGVVVISASSNDHVKGYHDITRYPNARLISGLVLFRWDAPLFFANAKFFHDRVLDVVASSPTPVRWLVVAAEPSRASLSLRPTLSANSTRNCTLRASRCVFPR